MQSANTQGGKGAPEEVGAADEQAQGGETQRDRVKDRDERIRLVDAEVAREGEEHRVHREGGADAKAKGERPQGGMPGAVMWAEDVAEPLDICSIGGEVAFSRFPAEVDRSGGGIHAAGHCAGVLGKDRFEEPDASRARDALDIKGETGNFFRVLLELPEPLEIAGVKDMVARRGLGFAELVEFLEAAFLEEVVDELAAGAAEVGAAFGGLERCAAVFAGDEGCGAGAHGQKTQPVSESAR